MGPFITHIIVADANKPAALAVESVLQHEACAAAVLLVMEVCWAPSVSDGNIVKPLVLGEFGARESVRYGREPCAGCGGLLHPFLDFRRQPFHESSVEGNFAVAMCFPVSRTSGSNIVPVCLDVDGFIADEGAC